MQKPRSIFRMALTFTLSLVIGLAAAQAQATIIDSLSRSDFHSQVSSIPVETWDEWSSGTFIYDGSTRHGITYTYVADLYSPVTFSSFQVTNAFLASSGKNTLGINGSYVDPSTSKVIPVTYFTSDGITFGFQNFYEPTYAFAIDISTDAPTPGTFTAIVNNNTSVVYTSVFDPFGYHSYYDANGNLIDKVPVGQFIGFISPVAIYSVTITYNLDLNAVDPEGYAYGWTLDTLIPLPSTLLLLGSGLAGLGLWRFRKRV